MLQPQLADVRAGSRKVNGRIGHADASHESAPLCCQIDTEVDAQLRLEQGYSIQDLQAYLGLEHPQAIYHWQHGRNLPSVDNLYALSKLWGVPMDKIIVEQAA